jgi:hypothetical protein
MKAQAQEVAEHILIHNNYVRINNLSWWFLADSKNPKPKPRASGTQKYSS